MATPQDAVLAQEAQLIYTRCDGFEPLEGDLRRWYGKVRYNNPRIPLDEVEFEIYIPKLFPQVPPVVRCLSSVKHPNFDKDGFVKLDILQYWRAEYHVYQVINKLVTLMRRVPPRPLQGSTRVAPAAAFPPNRSRVTSRGSPRISRSSIGVTSSISTPATSTSTVSSLDSVSKHEETIRVLKQQLEQKQTRLAMLQKELERLQNELMQRDEQVAMLKAKIDSMASSIGQTKTEIQSYEVKLSFLEEFKSEVIALSDLLASLHEKYSNGEVSIYDFAKLYRKYAKSLYLARKRLELAEQRMATS